MTQGFGPLNSFLATGTTIMRPGFSPTLSTPLVGVEISGRILRPGVGMIASVNRGLGWSLGYPPS
jgi:hypothetical protein